MDFGHCYRRETYLKENDCVVPLIQAFKPGHYPRYARFKLVCNKSLCLKCHMMTVINRHSLNMLYILKDKGSYSALL